MITSVFKKSTPFTATFSSIQILIFFLIFQFRDLSWLQNPIEILKKVLILCFLILSAFLVEAIGKNHELTKDSSYNLYFYNILLLFIPDVFNNLTLVIANFALLMALRSLVSLQNIKNAKLKLLDASLWIFVATALHFWSVLYIFMVFVSVLPFLSKEFRTLLVPFIAFFVVSILYYALSLMFQYDALDTLQEGAFFNFSLDYFVKDSQNMSFAILCTTSMVFVFSNFLFHSSHPVNLYSSYKKVYMFFVIAIVFFVLTNNKSNEMLLFLLGPLSMLITFDVETPQSELRIHTIFVLLSVLAISMFFVQIF